MDKDCNICIYYEFCKERDMCEDFYTCEESYREAEIDDYIEREREEFRKQWFEYID